MNKMPKNLRDLIEEGYVYPARLPQKNDFLFGENSLKNNISSQDLSELNLNKLNQLDGYLVFLTEKDYGALSPLMWNSLFEEKNLNYRAIYFVANPNNAKEIVGAFKSDPKYFGGGFGSGWKEKFEHLDFIEPKSLDSINFVARDSDTNEIIGYNTDIEGLLLPLRKKFREIGNGGLEKKTIVVFGAGGVGKELPKQLVQEGVSKIYLINRTVKKVEDLARKINLSNPGVVEYAGEESIGDYLLNPNVDAIINLTKKGAEPLEEYSSFAGVDLNNPNSVSENNKSSLELSSKLLEKNPEVIIYDITLPINNNPKTLELAKKTGLKNLIKGTGMVVNQGIIAAEKLHLRNKGFFKDSYSPKKIESVFYNTTR